MRAVLVAVAAVALALAGRADPSPMVRVDFSNPGLSPSHWTLTINPDGSGHFHSEGVSTASGRPLVIEAPSVDRDIHLSGDFTERVFQSAHQHKLFKIGCESHLKVAFQGWKKLTYTGPEGEGSCEFNFAKDKDIQALGDSLVAVAGTILEGAKLELLLVHDRLGLDQELAYLVEAAGDGRAEQLCAIQGILARLANDPEVMVRVQKRAKWLLARAEK